MHWRLALAGWRMHMDLCMGVDVASPKYWVAVVEQCPPLPGRMGTGRGGVLEYVNH